MSQLLQILVIITAFVNSAHAVDKYDIIPAYSHACFNDKYYNKSTIFHAPKNGTVNGIKLHHLNGSLSCGSNMNAYWGCNFQTLLFHVPNREIYYPSTNTQNVIFNTNYSFYTITNYNSNNSINYTLLYPTYNVSTNDEFMLQYWPVLLSDNNINITNSSTTCASIYFLYTITKETTISPTIEPTISSSEYVLYITVTYYFPASHPTNLDKKITNITKLIVTQNLSCITNISQHIITKTSSILSIDFVIMVCDENIQIALQNDYDNNLQQLLLNKMNSEKLNISLDDIYVVTKLTDSAEAANPTPFPVTPVTTIESHGTVNNSDGSVQSEETIIFVVIFILFMVSIFIIAIVIMYYQKRKVSAVKLNMGELKVGLLDPGEDAKSGDVIRCDTLFPMHQSLIGCNNDSFELISNDSFVPGSVKLSVIKHDEIPKKEGFYVRAITEYQNDNNEQLNFEENAILFIMHTTENGWWYGINENGLDGWIPSNYVNKLDKNERKQLEKQQQKQTDGENYIELLTELMDKSYQNIKDNKLIFDNIPKVIAPPMIVTDGVEENISSSSSSSFQEMDIHKTIGSVTKSD